jgi:hypothetical protein|tara:strand:- start:673 stop:909 length:237 start_codon:yes stop_codon:yes gene_type:complete
MRFLTLHQLLKERDKQQHLKVCFGLGLFFLPVIGLFNSIISIFLIGLIKELYDHYYGSGFCWYDMQSNMVGLILSILI